MSKKFIDRIWCVDKTTLISNKLQPNYFCRTIKALAKREDVLHYNKGRY